MNWLLEVTSSAITFLLDARAGPGLISVPLRLWETLISEGVCVCVCGDSVVWLSRWVGQVFRFDFTLLTTWSFTAWTRRSMSGEVSLTNWLHSSHPSTSPFFMMSSKWGKRLAAEATVYLYAYAREFYPQGKADDIIEAKSDCGWCTVLQWVNMSAARQIKICGLNTWQTEKRADISAEDNTVTGTNYCWCSSTESSAL